MDFKKKKICFLGIAIYSSLIIILFYFINYIPDREVITDSKNNNYINTNAITMMYETEANSGEYQIASDSSWPQEGYVFNEELSKCENGSKVTWNDENKKVIMQANISDRCYVYFDKEPDNLISFTIDGVSYYAEDGMTWKEWIDSEYNKLDAVVDGNYVYINPFSFLPLMEDTFDYVSSFELIVENKNYFESNEVYIAEVTFSEYYNLQHINDNLYFLLEESYGFNKYYYDAMQSYNINYFNELFDILYYEGGYDFYEYNKFTQFYYLKISSEMIDSEGNFIATLSYNGVLNPENNIHIIVCDPIANFFFVISPNSVDFSNHVIEFSYNQSEFFFAIIHE